MKLHFGAFVFNKVGRRSVERAVSASEERQLSEISQPSAHLDNMYDSRRDSLRDRGDSNDNWSHPSSTPTPRSHAGFFEASDGQSDVTQMARENRGVVNLMGRTGHVQSHELNASQPPPTPPSPSASEKDEIGVQFGPLHHRRGATSDCQNVAQTPYQESVVAGSLEIDGTVQADSPAKGQQSPWCRCRERCVVC